MTAAITKSLNKPATGLASRAMFLARDIKLSHSVFALPFALLAAFLAAAHAGRLPEGASVALIVLCMVLARTVAMAMNRWADRRLDALNPRTASRAIPAGRLTRRFVLLTAGSCAVAFIVATAGFWWLRGNVYPLVLSPFVLMWLVAYSFTKRFTSWCHLFLGSALALSPLAAAVAIEPTYLTGIEPYLLAAMVMCWVAGFDMIYALQDVASDHKSGVFSLPVRWGVEPALWASRVLHVISLAALVWLWHVSPALGGGFALAIGIVAVLLIVEHALVWRSSMHHIHIAFLTVNGVISLLVGALGVADVVWAVAGGSLRN